MSVFDIFKKLEEEKAAKPVQPIEWIVVGLGNPGSQYDNTRHNAGFRALESYCARSGQKIDRMKFKALAGEGMLGGKRVLFLKPQTFMNLSGEAVRDAAAFYKIPPERVIVLSDDVSLDVGTLRVRPKGSAGGTNGSVQPRPFTDQGQNVGRASADSSRNARRLRGGSFRIPGFFRSLV